MAKNILFKENLRLCIVKDKKVIFKSTSRGILPMFTAVKDKQSELIGASVADRVIGRAAAILNVYSKTSSIYTDIVSKNALEILKLNNIDIDYNQSVSYIMNRTKDDLCPVEKISTQVDDNDYAKLLQRIEEFLFSIKAIERI